MNPIVVHKYGGSSLADLEHVRRVAARIVDTVHQQKRVVAVVSAMGDTTDSLLARARELSGNPNRRELDMLLSVGERISTALLAIAIDDLGVPAVSFTGSQSGIITDTRHNRARIIEVRPYRLLDELDAGKVVIVAGYQGVSYAREITTLGRGGTDTTAVALAAALDAEYCEICSDVDGVYTADPRIVDDGSRLDSLDHDSMLALARGGARVLHPDCVAYASRHGVALFAKNTQGPRDDTGTVVRVNAPEAQRPILAIAHRDRVAEVTLAPGGDTLRLVEEMTAMGALAISASGGGGLATRFLIDLADTHHLEALQERLSDRVGDQVAWRLDRGTVTLVGHGLGDDPGLVRRAVAIATEITGEGPHMHLGALDLTLCVAQSHVRELVTTLHREIIAP